MNNSINDKYFSIFNKEYKLLQVLWEDKYQELKLVENDQIRFVLKIIQKEKKKEKNWGGKFFNGELNLLVQINCPYICQVLHGKQNEKNITYLMQYCSETTLFSYIFHNDDKTVKKCLEFFIQLIKALQVIHENQFVHRDLDPSNILLSLDLKSIKMINIGIRSSIYQSSFCSLPPEGFDSKRAAEFSYDLWGSVCILFFMIFQEFPFNHEINQTQEINRKCTPKYNSKVHLAHNQNLAQVSGDVLQLIEKVFVVDPKNRINYSEIFELQFFQNRLDHQELDSFKRFYLYLEKNKITPVNKEIDISEFEQDEYAVPILTNNEDDPNFEKKSRFIIALFENFDVNEEVSHDEEVGILQISSFEMNCHRDVIQTHGPKVLKMYSPSALKKSEVDLDVPDEDDFDLDNNAEGGSVLNKTNQTPTHTNNHEISNPEDEKELMDDFDEELMNLAELQHQQYDQQPVKQIGEDITLKLYLHEIGQCSVLSETINSLFGVEIDNNSRTIICFILSQTILVIQNRLLNSVVKKINIFSNRQFQDFISSANSDIVQAKLQQDIRIWSAQNQLFFFGIDQQRQQSSGYLSQTLDLVLWEKDFNDIKLPMRIVLDQVFQSCYQFGKTKQTENAALSSKFLKVSLYLLLSMLINKIFHISKLEYHFKEYFTQIQQRNGCFDFCKFSEWVSTSVSSNIQLMINRILGIAFGDKSNFDSKSDFGEIKSVGSFVF